MPAKNMFGIVGLEYQLPSLYIDQEEVANNIDFEVDKIKIGLGLEQMGVPSRREDSISLALNAVSKLMKKYKLSPQSVGRLEVGTESNPDGSKSIKSYLTDLFPGNTSICGCDSVHACYSATNALLNAVSWMESSLWDGRLAIVVATDVAMYKDKRCQPTGGAGAVAILVGPNSIYRIVPSSIIHYFTNQFDFMKPRKTHPFPVVKGKESIENYRTAFEVCYGKFREKMGDETFDYIVLHSPYTRLPEKMCVANHIDRKKFLKSLEASRKNGNAYSASLYLSLISLLDGHDGKIGEKILMFSYGSGTCSSMFCLERISQGCIVTGFEKRLLERRKILYPEFVKLVEEPVPQDNYEPREGVSLPGYYLKRISSFERHYECLME
ncbi:3-hydroxy-3-methylglutaryl-CoA synthase 2 [Encephalitozoon intestinalis ATCC 50506]|uniref:3-hydroxy-3-methylglutaryl-CoA synthase 2 n=1 Tax=Encephalitozoon intestinalis (strain ATCC 50506) TaxID=876142 RepID=E0S9I6_ENCIT|nr:3-hydroxy-3-methylglutaryl-CoA synthase 2 [Encephalitozoon intestinalis ATCC 50506]ADM12371.1 3-hydroxy-3-methylglutaryl-CoA synthase 2 [Encephalitozoon intestinalis ATCC 50506]UTX46203.1 hydroxymethylglutaryl-CoA synthase A [Encephalitozoon intestinalis]